VEHSSKVQKGQAKCGLDTEHGRLKKTGFLDRCDEDLPLEVVYLEVSSGHGLSHMGANCLLLRTTGEDKHFRRVGIAFLEHVPRDEEYLFHGLQKEVITLV
jgi:hypothetical protein